MLAKVDITVPAFCLLERNRRAGAAERPVIYFSLKSGLMDFCDLQERLLRDVKRRVSSGEITERKLARTTGISQPHMHNILKGVRDLTLNNADRILQALRLSVCDLLEIQELQHGLDWHSKAGIHGREVPVVAGLLGSGSSWPPVISRFERYHLAESHFQRFRQPVAGRLAPDPAMSDLFAGGELIILETDLKMSDSVDPVDLFLVALHNGIFVRYLRVGRHWVYVVDSLSAQRPLQWTTIRRSSLVTAVKARLHFREHLQAPGVPRRPPGTCGAPLPRSVAN